jgi:hypothetical protein
MTRAEALAECQRLVALHGITPHDLARITACPCVTYDPRYQFAPGEKTFGAGFAAVGLGRDVDTGKPWGKK